MFRPDSFRAGEELSAALEAFRAASGLEITVKLFQPAASERSMLSFLPEEMSLHRSSFCVKIKGTRKEACLRCDLREVPARRRSEREIFVNTCHAGASELIVPLFAEEDLVGIGYLGQFRTGVEGPPELRRLTPAQRKNLHGLAVLLRAYLAEQVRSPRFRGETSETLRAGRIRRFLLGRMKGNPGLPELAKHLGLSVSRAGHLVRETCGVSFTALRDALRLERARELLAFGDGKVAAVAEECGFADPRYFHRFFRKQTGTTPARFRSAKRPEA